MFLVHARELSLKGVTTVYGDTLLRARIAATAWQRTGNPDIRGIPMARSRLLPDSGVCAGTMSLRDAQEQIATNWIEAYERASGAPCHSQPTPLSPARQPGSRRSSWLYGTGQRFSSNRIQASASQRSNASGDQPRFQPATGRILANSCFR